jgi:hypothetical protein
MALYIVSVSLIAGVVIARLSERRGAPVAARELACA